MAELAMKHQHDPNEMTPWREERVFIVPHEEHGFQVVPPYKVVSRGQTVTFRILGGDSFTIEPRDGNKQRFERFFDKLEVQGDLVSVHVKDDAPSGFYAYRAVCKSTGGPIEARGLSSPGMIVDP